MTIIKTKTKREIALELKPIQSMLNSLGKLLLPVLWEAKDVFSSLYSAQKEIDFQDFIEGIAIDFSYNSLNEKDVKQLTKRVSNSKNHQYMSNILDSVFFSKSKFSRTILGLITGKFLRDDSLDYEDLVLCCALKDTFDDDLNAFWRFYGVHKLKTNVGDKTTFLNEYTEKDRLIVEKLQNNGILGRDLVEGRLAGVITPLRYEITSVSVRLKAYMDSIQSLFVKVKK